MSTTRRSRARAAGAVISAIVLAAVATGCGSSDDAGGGGGAKAGSAQKAGGGKSVDKAAKKAAGGKDLTDRLAIPKMPAEMTAATKSGGKGFDWKNWDDWKKQRNFLNPLDESLWTPKRMSDAKDADKGVDKDTGKEHPGTDAAPGVVLAKGVNRPYLPKSIAPVGKLFFDTPKGQAVCSGTLVKDPANPGRSNLVWTAGHCVHAGGKGSWYRNLIFVPSYNNGKTADGSLNLKDKKVAPFGGWKAGAAQTTKYWTTKGANSGGAGSPHDYAILKVAPPKGSSKSLEETVGKAAPVWFNAPEKLKLATAYGYPAAFPYGGTQLRRCPSPTGRLAVDPKEPNLHRIGCSMTGGSSGGPWFAKDPKGRMALVSNTSIGVAIPLWLAGPQLGDLAKAMLNSMADVKN